MRDATKCAGNARTRKDGWPKRVRVGKAVVPVYRRLVNGRMYCLVPDHSTGRRRWRSFKSESDAVEAATDLARRLSNREVLAASLTNREASEYIAALEMLAPYDLNLLVAVNALAEALRLCGDLQRVLLAAEQFAKNNKAITPKLVSEAVCDLIEWKQAHGASGRYVADLRSRLGKFGRAVVKHMHEVTVADVQAYLDSQRSAPLTYMNDRRVIGLLFEHGRARGWNVNNPALASARVKVRPSPIEFYSVEEMASILNAAQPDILPVIVFGAFCGLRAAEVERLRWEEVDFGAGVVVVGADRAKTATRRVVQIPSNAMLWLAPYAGRTGPVWPDAGWRMYRRLSETIRSAGVKPRSNGLRHSYATYKFALCSDAGLVAGQMGNTPAVLHKFYRNLVKPREAKLYFELSPASASQNVIPIAVT